MKKLILILVIVAMGISTKAGAISSSELIAGVNQVRANNGAASLTINYQLTVSAQAKAEDMCRKNYWAHGNWSSFINSSGYQYSKAGENLAYGFESSSSTVTGWVNSPTHFNNMVDRVFKETGFGIKSCPGFNGNSTAVIVVEHFGSPLYYTAPAPAPKPVYKPTVPNKAPRMTVNKPAIEIPNSEEKTPQKPPEKPKNELYELLNSMITKKCDKILCSYR